MERDARCPGAFISDLDRAVIDEVQRGPELVLAIKQSVDADPRPGRFLLTGSANLLTIATVRESLAGRIAIVPLYPLGRSERLLRRYRRAILMGSSVWPRPPERTSCRESFSTGAASAVPAESDVPEPAARRRLSSAA